MARGDLKKMVMTHRERLEEVSVKGILWGFIEVYFNFKFELPEFGKASSKESSLFWDSIEDFRL